jgi:hypothetical protein
MMNFQTQNSLFKFCGSKIDIEIIKTYKVMGKK